MFQVSTGCHGSGLATQILVAHVDPLFQAPSCGAMTRRMLGLVGFYVMYGSLVTPSLDVVGDVAACLRRQRALEHDSIRKSALMQSAHMDLTEVRL